MRETCTDCRTGMCRRHKLQDSGAREAELLAKCGGREAMLGRIFSNVLGGKIAEMKKQQREEVSAEAMAEHQQAQNRDREAAASRKRRTLTDSQAALLATGLRGDVVRTMLGSDDEGGSSSSDSSDDSRRRRKRRKREKKRRKRDRDGDGGGGGGGGAGEDADFWDDELVDEFGCTGDERRARLRANREARWKAIHDPLDREKAGFESGTDAEDSDAGRLHNLSPISRGSDRSDGGSEDEDGGSSSSASADEGSAAAAAAEAPPSPERVTIAPVQLSRRAIYAALDGSDSDSDDLAGFSGL